MICRRLVESMLTDLPLVLNHDLFSFDSDRARPLRDKLIALFCRPKQQRYLPGVRSIPSNRPVLHVVHFDTQFNQMLAFARWLIR